MTTRAWRIFLILLVVGVGVVAAPVIAQTDDTDNADDAGAGDGDGEEPAQTIGDEIVVIGSRSDEPRSVSDSPVPIDIITGDEFRVLGNEADLTDNLKALVPSYTATPATGDGSAFIRPTSLRGTAPDQLLVLVNGKRRHRSSLVHIFAPAAGNGAHGVDIGMIPGISIKRVEVLRDGAASQYGSDAIAGVINFVLKDASDGLDVLLQGGQHFEGESSLKAAVNAGFSLPNNGFFNVSLEMLDNEALDRATPRPEELALIAAGVPGVGDDTPFSDSPRVQSWGRPETSGLRLFFNGGMLVGESSQWYFHGGYGDTDGTYRFFYRDPQHASLAPLRAQGFTGLPAGYTPFLDGDQTDTSLVTGFTGVFSNGMEYDFSIGYGMNELDYFLNNTINPNLGLDAGGNIPQRDFDVGALEQEELNLNADFGKRLNQKLHLGFGLEWRDETFSLVAGEPNAYLLPGPSGFLGFNPIDSGDFSRDNWALYADLEHDVTENFMLQYALRYEDFSDFGDTLNWKLATRIGVTETFALRGAVSTGFHAPTPGQSNYFQSITTFDGTTGAQQEELLVPPTDPRAAALGGLPLTEETSLNISAGFTADFGQRTNVTLDFYQIEIEDRVYRTGNIPLPGSIFNDTISYYTNAMDVESSGFDLVVSSAFDWGSSSASTVWNFILAYNDLEVTNQTAVMTPTGPVLPVSEANIEDIENNYPNERFVINTNTVFNEDWNVMARVNYYGKHYDERGRIGAADEPSFEIGETIFVDLELGWQFRDNMRVALGAVNVFDQFPDKIGPPFSNRLSVGLPYPRRSVANYEGGSWYLNWRYTR